MNFDGGNVMSSTLTLRVLIFASFAALLSGAAFAKDDIRYRNNEHRFAVIFPGQPMQRDITYTTNKGAMVPAKQFYIEQGTDQFIVTVVKVTDGPAADDALVEHAAERLRQRGEVKFGYKYNYDPGVPGRQLNIAERNGRQLRVSMYMLDHRLVIAETSATPGNSAALQFEQSITLLDARGEDLDTGQGNGPG